MVTDPYPAGMTMFAGPDNDAGLAAAKAYCLAEGLTHEVVRIVRTLDGAILVRKK